ncbi:MAG: hypothetical protein RIR34_1218 [Actinomycetota bacterium]|jgi:hypothetical protein
MDRQDFIALMSPDGQKLLGDVAYESKTDVLKLVTRLRADGHEPGLVAAVLSQAKLRHRAKSKFGEFAERMLFTEPGLEQASRLKVAALHAGRFKVAGVETVADLGCGIGTESLAMASLGIKVSAFELDEVTAAIATFNLLPFENATVEQADATKVDISGYDGIFFDPARRELTGAQRAKAVRKFDPSMFSPNFDWVAERCSQAGAPAGNLKAAGIKVGPGHPHDGIPENCEAQWVSVDGDLVELALWFGSAARPGVARAALLMTDHGNFELRSSHADVGHAPLGELEEYVYEPDNAVVRSHLIAVLAEETRTHSFSPEIAYLTSSELISNEWLRGYRVLENLTFDRKKLKARIRELGIGVLEIKKRGADIVPEQLRKELAPKGPNKATLIVTRVGDAHRVLICEAL